MNLTEVLDTAALPDIPARAPTGRPPMLHPKLVAREHVEGGEPIVSAVISGVCWLYRFTPFEWQIVQLFDGKRSYEDVVELFFEQTGQRLDAGELRDFCARLDQNNFWYKTPLEQNAALKQKLREERQKRSKKKSKYGDIAHMEFSAWDPDAFLDQLYPRLKFIYTRWFTLLTVALFAFMTYVFVVRWDEIGHDTLQFFKFTEKSGWDLVEFWFLACGVLYVHEMAHGLACKHFGGHVRRMGFHLIYLTPAFFTDVTEAWVYANPWQRIITMAWGAWSEMLLCAIATPIWWGTPAGSFVHAFAYKVILITGVGVIFFNWNPLIKLDGYYLLTEALTIPDLKEESTAFVSGWVKKKIWRLPVEVPYVPKWRRLGFTVYALLSGFYSYGLLYFVARFAGNVASHFNPDFAFVLTWGSAYLIFRSRIKTLVRFMKTLYLDKKDRVLAWFTPQRRLVAAAALAVLLFTPLWRESAEARFSLEPRDRTVVRAAVPGTVVEVNAEEGQQVPAGALLLRLRNLPLESEAAQTRADWQVASARATQAQLRYADFGMADRERQQLAERSRLLQEQVAMLAITSPIAGQIMTPRVADRIGSNVEAGTELVEVADLSSMRARIFLPEYEFRKVRVDAPARLLCDSAVTAIDGRVSLISPASSEIEAGLTEKTPYRGIRPPNYYSLAVVVANPQGTLRTGMSGTAKIYGRRRSIAGLALEPVEEFFARKFW